MRTITRAALLCGAVMASTVGLAHADQWEVLGKRAVSFSTDRDTIPVGLTGTYKKIKLKVTGNPIHMLDLKVHFANGDVQDVSVRKNIPKGGETRVIDLKGANRVIKKITMVYQRKLNRRMRRARAEVIVFGKKATGGPAPVVKKPAPVVKKPVAAAQQWVFLGTRQVGFSADKDTIMVTGAAGAFRKIKFKVFQNGIHLIDLKVHFANGEVADVPTRFDINAGGESRVIDLPGAVRVIKKIVFRYKTKGRMLKKLIKGKAKVQCYGLKIAGSGGISPATPKPATPKVPMAGKWSKLGERTVKPRVEKDTIRVGMADGRFTALKFRVKDAPVRILDMKVHFKNGEVKDVSLRSMIKAGGESRVIDLPGNKRIITHVTFWYKEQGRARLRPGRPHVALWGRH